MLPTPPTENHCGISRSGPGSGPGKDTAFPARAPGAVLERIRPRVLCGV
jgi:hypothetical protein